MPPFIFLSSSSNYTGEQGRRPAANSPQNPTQIQQQQSASISLTPNSSNRRPAANSSRKHEEDRLIVFERGDLVFVFNFHWNESYIDYKIGCSKPGKYKGKTVVIVDEDEPQLVKTTELEVQLPSCKKDAKISYPSRDAPDSVEISFGDIGSLAPETFLTSQIMNFYIQYLRHQAPPTNSPICDYHIFNTYFYPKLKEAVSYKVLSFLFSYRCSASYMSEEWNYLNQGVAPSDLPIADKIWDNLPCSIDEKTIAVPQQKNDYDCGLFVLFFMERFMEEAPERLKKKDLTMFGKQWFRPEEASGLRARIRNLQTISGHTKKLTKIGKVKVKRMTWRMNLVRVAKKTVNSAFRFKIHGSSN